jgi:hypothetical protein
MQEHLPQNKSYETTELKLAALLLSEISNSNFEVFSQDNLAKKTIKIIYPADCEESVNKFIREYLERRARVDVYLYNHNLNLLRNKLRER